MTPHQTTPTAAPATNEPIEIVDLPELIDVAPEPSVTAQEDTWLPAGMAARLTLTITATAVVALFAIALPLWLTGTSAAGAFGIAAVPAMFCGGGFGAIFGAALFSEDERTD